LFSEQNGSEKGVVVSAPAQRSSDPCSETPHGTPAGTTKNGLFEPFIYINEHFTKTGSGQT
jgi:hypothetical protein